MQAIFKDPDWYAERMLSELDGSSRLSLSIDMQHLDGEIVEIAIEDLYAENALDRLRSRSRSLTF